MFRTGELVCRKRMREQEIADEEAAKKKKEWEKEWEVSREPLFPGAFSLGDVVKTNLVKVTSTLALKRWTKDISEHFYL